MTNEVVTKTRAKPGPKLKQIDWRAIEEAAKIYCTQEELAAIAGVCVETLQTACKRDLDIEFSEWIGQKRAFGKLSLRRAQYQAAMRGNVTMLIWLGKQWLGQRDKADVTANDQKQVVVVSYIPGMRTSDMDAMNKGSAT